MSRFQRNSPIVLWFLLCIFSRVTGALRQLQQLLYDSLQSRQAGHKLVAQVFCAVVHTPTPAGKGRSAFLSCP